MELAFYSPTQAERDQGRSFNCSGCPDRTKERRRCAEDREFTKDDNPQVFPIRLYPGGAEYGFCPAKATWDDGSVDLFRKLSLCAETGVMLERGGINDQPEWFMEQFSWFAPVYKQAKTMSLLERVLRTMPGLNRLATGGKRGDNARGTASKR